MRRSRVAGLVFALALGLQAPVVSAATPEPVLIHVPVRWCVLEGTEAARRGPDEAVLTRIRRASNLLAPTAGVTLRSPFNRSLVRQASFPVIKDPRPGLGDRGDVRVPTESMVEYHAVVAACERAWRDIRRAAASGDIGGVAKGPIAVIIDDFVDGRGQTVDIWGYAMSADTNPDYCSVQAPKITRAAGGSMLLVDSADGDPRPASDRNLVAHEFGHILRLGHGDGLENPGGMRGRIDKWCDMGENPDITPGSFMTFTLRYDQVTPYQRRLLRGAADRHIAAVRDRTLVIRPMLRSWFELVCRNDGDACAVRHGTRLVRSVPRPTALSPIPRLWAAGLRGDRAADAPDDAQPKGARRRPASSDLLGVAVAVDEAGGWLSISHEVLGALGTDKRNVFTTLVDSDGDAGTGGPVNDHDDSRPRGRAGPAGVDLVTRIVVRPRGTLVARAWRWDGATDAWLESDPAPSVELADRVAETADASVANAVVATLPLAGLGVGEGIRFRTELRTRLKGGGSVVDSLPAGERSNRLIALDLRTVDYPRCIVNRHTGEPGFAAPGRPATIEVYGFGSDGQVSIWLDHGEEPLMRGFYEELPVDCECPWVTELPVPASTADGLHMVQVSLDGTALTADCPLVVGATPPDFEPPLSAGDS